MPSMRVFRLLVPLATILDLFDMSKASSPQLDHLLPAGNLWTLGNFWTTNSGGWQPCRKKNDDETEDIFTTVVDTSSLAVRIGCQDCFFLCCILPLAVNSFLHAQEDNGYGRTASADV
ncbi:hypothetical protein QC763_0024560 [Podospora pseudopauciseta]|uniref:Uncharacterized protein n=1 Tax=Podospora pseudopauciseta TaxID=2093780 RepID=A0ABR0I255_9PEZI|nr:hypothetical protein QC763_0024560 [Podospora pseudopauciseta]